MKKLVTIIGILAISLTGTSVFAASQTWSDLTHRTVITGQDIIDTTPSGQNRFPLRRNGVSVKQNNLCIGYTVPRIQPVDRSLTVTSTFRFLITERCHLVSIQEIQTCLSRYSASQCATFFKNRAKDEAFEVRNQSEQEVIEIQDRINESLQFDGINIDSFQLDENIN